MEKSRKTLASIQKELSIVKPQKQHMQEFLEQAHASENLHANWAEPAKTSEDYLAYLDKINKDQHFGAFITLAKSNEIVGVVNISNILMGCCKSGFISYYAFLGFEHRGIMLAGTSLVVQYAFTQLDLHRLEAVIHPDNSNSLTFIQKLGFEWEGVAKKYLLVEGKWQDHIKYALTKESLGNLPV